MSHNIIWVKYEFWFKTFEDISTPGEDLQLVFESFKLKPKNIFGRVPLKS